MLVLGNDDKDVGPPDLADTCAMMSSAMHVSQHTEHGRVSGSEGEESEGKSGRNVRGKVRGM